MFRLFCGWRWPLWLPIVVGLAILIQASFHTFVSAPTSSHLSGQLRGGPAVTLAQISPGDVASVCKHSGKAGDIVQQEFGWNPSFLSPQYRNATLCDDQLQVLPATTCLRSTDLFQRIGWPVDLLEKQYANQVVCTKAHQPPAPTAGNCPLDSALPNNPLAPIHYCDAFVGFLQWIADSFNNGANWLIAQSQHMTERIPPDATYGNPAVIAVWQVMLHITDGLVVVAFCWIGMRLLTAGKRAVSYADVIDVVPRLFLTLVFAHSSLKIAQLLIDFNNALCDVLVNHVGMSPIPLGNAGKGAPVFLAAFLQVLHGLMNVLVVIQAAIGIAGVAIAITLGPLCLLCLFHADTQQIAHTWLRILVALCLMRFLQVLTITVGGRMLAAAVLQNNPGAELLNLLIGIGILFIAFVIPEMLRHWMLVPVSAGGTAVVTVASGAADAGSSLRGRA
ncbi:hypothetical protein [Dictyobacter aurantiacus]|uniref:hypothetical protein n=1 Tax=Dictyobacter aurantiacus TaxID=1936993 RepID=UPI000F83EDEA|nr:hypothetical protein [Dictyobacter aurantiacus]